MRKEDLYQAIGELDEKLLAKSEAGWRPSRVFRTALTAAACLLLTAGIGSAAFFGFGRDPQGEAVTPGESFVVGSGEMDSTWTAADRDSAYGDWNQCDMILNEGSLYFTTINADMGSGEVFDAQVFRYDPRENHTEHLDDFPAAFTRAQSGNYCTDCSTGDVYALGDSGLTKVGSIPEYDARTHTLIAATDDTLLYSVEVFRNGYFFDIYELNLADQTICALYSNNDSDVVLTASYLRDGVLYYERSVVMGETGYYAMDIQTGESRQLNITLPEGKVVRSIAFFDDAIYLVAYPESAMDPSVHDTEEAELCKVDYDTLEITALVPMGFGYDIQQDGDRLYCVQSIFDEGGVLTHLQIYEYDRSVSSLIRTIERPTYESPAVYCANGCYYDDSREDHPGIFFYDAATGQTTRIDPVTQGAIEPSSPEEPQPEEAAAEPGEDTFFALFHELDESSMRTYLDAHPETLSGGWGGIDINASGLEDAGTDIRTTNGDQVLAVNARDGILLVRVEVESPATRGVLAICKDTSQLRLCASENLGKSGQTAGEICEANGGVLAMTGSAFIDEKGDGNGGQLSGLMVSGGEVYGTAMGDSYKRLELREDDKMYIVDSTASVGDGTRDAVEFQPAVIVDGEVIRDTGWDGSNPRALIGQSDRLETMMLVMEGRLTDSFGCGVEECAEIMQKYGCVQAMNLDGGTSAIMYYKGECVTRCSNPDLSDGRQLPSAWVYGKTE